LIPVFFVKFSIAGLINLSLLPEYTMIESEACGAAVARTGASVKIKSETNKMLIFAGDRVFVFIVRQLSSLSEWVSMSKLVVYNIVNDNHSH